MAPSADAIPPGGSGVPPSPSAAPEPLVDPAPIVARHRRAIGGDGAIAKAARLRVRQKTKELGLDGSEIYVIDDGRMRAESKIPALAAESVQVWDGKRLVVRGLNGDVRAQGQSDRAHAVTLASVLSLGYLRTSSTAIRALAPVDESGITYDRLVVVPEGGAPAEIWVRPDGLTAKVILQKAGRTQVRRVEAHGTFGGLVLPKIVSKSDATTRGSDTTTVESVDFVSAPMSGKLFEAPVAKLDATFPKGTTKVTVPAGLLRERYLSVSGSLGGRASLFLVDTGASTTVFDEDFLAEAGIRPAGGASFASDALFKGVRFARVPSFEVAGIRLGPQVALTIPLRRSEGFPLPVDGILGYDFWSRFVTAIDYPMGTMTFHRPDAFTPDAEDVAVPFELEGTTLHVPVTVNGNDAGTFTLDTGNGGEITLHRFDGIERLVPRGPNPLRFARGIAYGSSGAAAYETSVDLGLGPFVYRSAPVLLLDPRDPSGDATGGNGNVGVDFLKGFRVTFDYARAVVYLRQKRALRPASTLGVSGMTIKPAGAGAFVIDEVAPGWPADKAGLKPGDQVLAVDGVPLTGAGTNDLVPGEARRFQVRRGGQTLEISLIAATHP